MKLGFTPRQQPRYRDFLNRAFDKHCERTGLNPDVDGAFENWKTSFLLETVGVPSSSYCNHVEHYDRVMLKLAEIIGDVDAIAHFTANAERVMRWLINDRRAKLSTLKGVAISDAYIFEICIHIVPSYMTRTRALNELPAETLWNIFKALDANVRSLRRQKPREARHAA